MRYKDTIAYMNYEVIVVFDILLLILRYIEWNVGKWR